VRGGGGQLKVNLLNLLGAIFFVKEELMLCILISCEQNKTMQGTLPILALTTLCLFSESRSIFQLIGEWRLLLESKLSYLPHI
jgi:hypothetical protein